MVARAFATETDTASRDATTTSSPLHLAAQNGRLAEVEKLLASGQAVDSRDARDMTPLHYAAAKGHIEIASLLLNRGADPNAQAPVGMTPLHFAAMLGRAEMTGLLVRRGARSDARNADGMTPLHLAADERVVHALAVGGADVNAKSQRGLTPLHTARQSSVARSLLDAGADLRIRTPSGRTAMEIAGIESLEPRGLSLHSVMMGRLRGLIGEIPLTLTNISEQVIPDLTLDAQSPACSIDITPAAIGQVLPGASVNVALGLTRSPDAGEKEYPVFVTFYAAGRELGKVDLKVDTHMSVSLEDRGMIRIAKGQLRKAPSRWSYVAYMMAPLLVLGAWFFLRRRR